LVYNYFDGNSWTVNQVVPDTQTSGPPGLLLRNNKLYCFHDGGGNLWYNVFDGVNWRGDSQVDDTNVSHSPSAVTYDGQVYVFHQGADDEGIPNGELWYNIYQGAGNWSGDQQVPNTSLHHSPAAIVWGSETFCLHMGTGSQDNNLWVNSFTKDSQWRGDSPISSPAFANSPAVISYNNSLWYFYQSNDGSNALHCGRLQLNGSYTFGNDQVVPGASLWYSPAPCVFNNRLYCFHHSASDDNNLYCQTWIGNNWAGEFQIPNISIANSPGVIVID
jgi:hypothetical protein